MNVKELPTAHQRHIYRSLRNGDLDVAAILDAVGGSYVIDWCVGHDAHAVAGGCEYGIRSDGIHGCRVVKLFRIPKA